MFNIYSIDDNLCEDILESYRNNPLISVITQPDAEALLRSSFHVAVGESKDIRLT